MRSITARLFVGTAFAAIGMFGADSTLGTWKFNAAKSKTAAGFQIKQQTDVREATPDGSVKVTRTGQMVDGTAVNFSFTYKYDGKKYPVTGGPFDTLSVKRTDTNTTTWEASKSGGKYHAKGKTVISADGKTMTQSASGTDAEGKPLSMTLVFDKQ